MELHLPRYFILVIFVFKFGLGVLGVTPVLDILWTRLSIDRSIEIVEPATPYAEKWIVMISAARRADL